MVRKVKKKEKKREKRNNKRKEKKKRKIPEEAIINRSKTDIIVIHINNLSSANNKIRRSD